MRINTNMNILFVYDDKSVIYQTQKVVGKHNLVLCKYCDLDNLRDEVIDIIIMDFNLKRIEEMIRWKWFFEKTI